MEVRRNESHDSMDCLVPPDILPEGEKEATHSAFGATDSFDEGAENEVLRCDDGIGSFHEVNLESQSVQEVMKRGSGSQERTPAALTVEQDNRSGEIEDLGVVIHLDEQKEKTVEKQIVQDNGLEFDVNVPWQRSLLKQLRHNEENGSKRNLKPQQPVGRILLGHTASRDFAVEFDHDDGSLITDTSSTVPIKAQHVHRQYGFGCPDEKPLFDDYSLENSKHDRITGEQQSPRSVREERNWAVGARPRGVSHRGPGVAGEWLEMEASHEEYELDDGATVTTAQLTSDPSNDACFCMGYNVLDMMMGPAPKPRNYNRPRRRLNVPHSKLGKVMEGSHEDIPDEWQQPYHARPGYQSHYQLEYREQASPRQTSQPQVQPRLRQARSKDPDGYYHNDQYDFV